MGSRLEANSTAVRKRIEGHRFENETGEEYGASKFGGFPEYFRRKKIKLQNLDAERRSQNADKPRIFQGTVAHVNGYTQPSLNDLHRLIVEYGGGFLQYLDGKTTVTHVIASSLTPSKKIEFRKYRVVKPAWVVDSIQAGKLLPWNAYRVVDEGPRQNVLGFQGGNVISQANTQRSGYREQTNASWYTDQVKDVAAKLGDSNFGDELPPSGQQHQSDQDLPLFHPRSGDDSIAASAYPENRSDQAASTDVAFHETEASHVPAVLPGIGADGPDSHSVTLPLEESPTNAFPTLGTTSEGRAVPVLQDGQPITDTTSQKPMTAEEHNAVLLAEVNRGLPWLSQAGL